jgi:MFS transporter, DHA3 family, macrolide efflux protein
MNAQVVLESTETSGSTVPTASQSLFRNKSFLFLWAGQLVSMLGNSVYTLALMWEMKVLTGSTVMMSAVSIASLVPMLVCGPFAGVLVDRWHKRTAMIWSDVIRAFVITVLTALVFAHAISPWMLIAGAAINNTVSSVFSPAQSALLPILVGKENLQKANSITQGTTVMTQIIGPFAGGILVAQVSMGSAFGVEAASFLVSVVSLILMTHREPTRVAHKLNSKQFMTEMKEGLEVIRGMRLVRTLIPIGLVANFLFAPVELVLIQYSTNVLHGSAQMYGALGACFSAGMLLGAILAGSLSKKIRKGMLIAITFPLSSLAVFAMAFTSTPWLAMVCLGLSGVFNMMVNILLMTILQSEIPQEKMGRVFGSFGVLIQGSQPFAQAIGGYLLMVFSVPVLMGAIGALATVDALFATFSKVVRGQE